MRRQYRRDFKHGVAYRSIRAYARRRITFLSGVRGNDLCEEPLSVTCSLCTTVCLPPSSCLNDGIARVKRHLEEGVEVRSSKEGEVSRHVAAGRLTVSARAAAASVKDPSSRFGHFINVCSCVKKGTRSDWLDDSSLSIEAVALLRKDRMVGED